MQKNLVIFFLCFFSIQSLIAQVNDVKHIIKNIQDKYAPDRRVEVFQIDISQKDDTFVLSGETTSKEAYNELLMVFKEKHPMIIDSIRLLPDAELGEKTEGVVYNSVGTIRYAPRYSSELVTQTLLGTPVKILEKKGGWHRIQTPDNYIGWINGSIEVMNEIELQEYNEKQKVIITSIHTTSFEEPDNQSMPVTDLVMGNVLELKSENNDYYKLIYPDGREAFVKTSDAKKVDQWLEDIVLTVESIVNLSYKFKGIPYLWGGTSSKGFDCSGLTKMVYLMHGITLPRDASQQVSQGRLIDTEREFSKLIPGDLIFFGSKNPDLNKTDERVVHVGIYLGDNHFIHASDYVRINSLNPNDKLFDEFNANRYLRTKRYVENGQIINNIKNEE